MSNSPVMKKPIILEQIRSVVLSYLEKRCHEGQETPQVILEYNNNFCELIMRVDTGEAAHPNLDPYLKGLQ